MRITPSVGRTLFEPSGSLTVKARRDAERSSARGAIGAGSEREIASGDAAHVPDAARGMRSLVGRHMACHFAFAPARRLLHALTELRLRALDRRPLCIELGQPSQPASLPQPRDPVDPSGLT